MYYQRSFKISLMPKKDNIHAIIKYLAALILILILYSVVGISSKERGSIKLFKNISISTPTTNNRIPIVFFIKKPPQVYLYTNFLLNETP